MLQRNPRAGNVHPVLNCTKFQALGADAVIGIDIDYEVLGAEGGMLMVSISGTAVALKGAAGGPAASPWTQPTG